MHIPFRAFADAQAIIVIIRLRLFFLLLSGVAVFINVSSQKEVKSIRFVGDIKFDADILQRCYGTVDKSFSADKDIPIGIDLHIS